VSSIVKRAAGTLGLDPALYGSPSLRKGLDLGVAYASERRVCGAKPAPAAVITEGRQMGMALGSLS
jgi:hypothetical protein